MDLYQVMSREEIASVAFGTLDDADDPHLPYFLRAYEGSLLLEPPDHKP